MKVKKSIKRFWNYYLWSRNIPELDNITKCFYLGHLNDEVSLRMAYSAADVFALPSKMDNLPLTVLESQSCNTPVVLYCTSGQQI